MTKYTQLFIDESRSYLETIGRALRGDGGSDPPLSEGSRLAHSIKGMALFEEQAAVAELASAMEEGLARAAAGLDGLHGHLTEGVAVLGRMIDDVEREGGVREGAPELVAAITEQLEG